MVKFEPNQEICYLNFIDSKTFVQEKYKKENNSLYNPNGLYIKFHVSSWTTHLRQQYLVSEWVLGTWSAKIILRIKKYIKKNPIHVQNDKNEKELLYTPVLYGAECKLM